MNFFESDNEMGFDGGVFIERERGEDERESWDKKG